MKVWDGAATVSSDTAPDNPGPRPPESRPTCLPALLSRHLDRLLVQDGIPFHERQFIRKVRPIGPLPTDVKPVTPDAPAVAAGALHWALPSTLATAHTWVSHLELRDLPIAPWTLVDPIAVPDQSPPTSAREKVMRLLWRWPEGETRARVLHGISVLECPPGAAANAVDPGSPAGAGRPKPTHGEFG